MNITFVVSTALQSQKEPATSHQVPSSDQQQSQVDLNPSLADYKPPFVASLDSIPIDQSNSPFVLSTTSSSDDIAMETRQTMPSVIEEFIDTSSTSAASMVTGGMQNEVSNLDANVPPSVESSSMPGLKRSASPQTPGSMGPPPTKSVKLEDDSSVSGLVDIATPTPPQETTNPIQIGSPITGSPFSFSTSATQPLNVVTSLSSSGGGIDNYTSTLNPIASVGTGQLPSTVDSTESNILKTSSYPQEIPHLTNRHLRRSHSV